MSTSERRILAVLLIASLVVAGCAGGGGGALVSSAPAMPVGNGSGTNGSSSPPAFDGPINFPAPGTTFAAITTDGTPLTVTIVSASGGPTNFQITDSSGTHDYTYQTVLTHPGAWQPGNGFGPIAVGTDNPPSPAFSPWGLSYVALGEWETPAPSGFPARFFVFGFDTPVSSMPISGTASFQGQGTVRGIVAGPNDVTGILQGDANLNVDFGAGQISGKLTNITAVDPCTAISSQWNDVTVNASIAVGTNKFSGTTGAIGTTGAASPFTLKSTATGNVNGAFYGPAANNLGGLWSLSDGTLTASGGIASARH